MRGFLVAALIVAGLLLLGSGRTLVGPYSGSDAGFLFVILAVVFAAISIGLAVRDNAHRIKNARPFRLIGLWLDAKERDLRKRAERD